MATPETHSVLRSELPRNKTFAGTMDVFSTGKPRAGSNESELKRRPAPAAESELDRRPASESRTSASASGGSGTPRFPVKVYRELFGSSHSTNAPDATSALIAAASRPSASAPSTPRLIFRFVSPSRFFVST